MNCFPFKLIFKYILNMYFSFYFLTYLSLFYYRDYYKGITVLILLEHTDNAQMSLSENEVGYILRLSWKCDMPETLISLIGGCFE